MSAPHYLDHAATTPISDAAFNAWVEAQHALRAAPGNPASLHAGGRTAKRMLEDARERIAHALGAQRAEVVLVSGATESDALGVTGAARAVRAANPQRTHVLLSEIEHDAVGEQSEVLRADGFSVSSLKVAPSGVVDIDRDALAEVHESLALASLALVSSEIGTIQPVGDLAATLAQLQEQAGSAGAGAASGAASVRAGQGSRPLVHTDAAQAVGVLDVNFTQLGVDLLTLGGHKIGAPVGTGVLLVKRGVSVRTDRPGGGHERGIRSGTPDVAGAAALAAALEDSVNTRESRVAHARGIRDALIDALPHLSAELASTVRLTVSPDIASPAIIHLSIPTAHPEAVLMAMDMAGVAVSAGSACHSGVTRPSAVRLAMGASESEALGVLRVSTAASTTADDIAAFVAALPAAVRTGQALDARDQAPRI